MRRPGREGERGGAAIIAALALLSLLAGVGLAASRNLLRESAIQGDALLGTRAALAAESGLAWFLAWAAGAGPADPGAPPPLPPDLLAQPAEDRLRTACSLQIRPEPSRDSPGTAAAYRVTAEGRCEVLAGDGPVRSFRQVRELVVAVPFQDSAGPPGTVQPATPRPEPRVLSWRIVKPGRTRNSGTMPERPLCDQDHTATQSQ